MTYFSYLLSDVKLDGFSGIKGDIVSCDGKLEIIVVNGWAKIPSKYICNMEIYPGKTKIENLSKVISKFQNRWRLKKVFKSNHTIQLTLELVAFARNRKKVIQELIDSEQSYVNSLRVMMNLKDFLVEKKWINDSEAITLFGNVPGIIVIAENVLDSLESTRSGTKLPSAFEMMKIFKIGSLSTSSSPVSAPKVRRGSVKPTAPLVKVQPFKVNIDKLPIGVAFKAIVPSLSGYSKYINGHAELSAVLQDVCHKSPSMMKTLNEMRNSDTFMKGHEIRGLMVKPVQRVPRYQLLFEEIIANTPTFHHDYENLIECLRLVKKATVDLNIKRGIYESSRILFDLRLRFPLLPETEEDETSSRVFVKKGIVSLKCSLNEKKWIDYEVFLFSDLILMDKYKLFAPSRASLRDSVKLATSKMLGGLFPTRSRDTESDAGEDDEDDGDEIYIHLKYAKLKELTKEMFRVSVFDRSYYFQEQSDGCSVGWFDKVQQTISTCQEGLDDSFDKILQDKKAIEGEWSKQIAKLDQELRETLKKYTGIMSTMKKSEDEIKEKIKVQFGEEKDFYYYYFNQIDRKLVDPSILDSLNISSAPKDDTSQLEEAISFYRKRSQNRERKHETTQQEIVQTHDGPKYRGSKGRSSFGPSSQSPPGDSVKK